MADGSGNLVIGDIREALVVAARTGMFYGQRMTLGHLYVVAGTTVDSSRLAQDGWLAGRVQLGDEQGITVDGNGSIIMADGVRNEVSIVAGRTGTFYGPPMTAGHLPDHRCRQRDRARDRWPGADGQPRPRWRRGRSSWQPHRHRPV